MSNENITSLEQIAEQFLREESMYEVLLVNDSEIINRYEIQTSIKNIYEFDPSAFLPNAEAMTLSSFINLTSNIIENAQLKANVVEDQVVKLTQEYPPDEFHNFGDEVIAYRLINREPANMNKLGTGRVQRSYSNNYDLQRPDFPNKMIIVESRPVDHTIELTCWAKTNRIANERAIWLEKLLINNTWRYQTNGVERFYWKDRLADSYMTSGEQRLFYRPLRFFVRFREFEVKLHPLIKNIETSYGGNLQ